MADPEICLNKIFNSVNVLNVMYTWVTIFKQYDFFVHRSENISNTLEGLAAFIDGG